MLVAGAMFRWAVNQDWLEHSPVHDISPLDHGHLPAWTAEEAARAIAELPEPFRRVVVLALYTGQRRGDLCTMGWSAYDGKSIRLVQQKTRKPMVIPVHPELAPELDRWERITTTILSNPTGGPWRPVLLSDQLPGKLQAIGLRKGLNVHGLRKLAAANLAEAGCTIHEIASITGHASLGMLQLYTASADQERMATAAIVRLTRRKKT
jgi:integrase